MYQHNSTNVLYYKVSNFLRTYGYEITLKVYIPLNKMQTDQAVSNIQQKSEKYKGKIKLQDFFVFSHKNNCVGKL